MVPTDIEILAELFFNKGYPRPIEGIVDKNDIPEVRAFLAEKHTEWAIETGMNRDMELAKVAFEVYATGHPEEAYQRAKKGCIQPLVVIARKCFAQENPSEAYRTGLDHKDESHIDKSLVELARRELSNQQPDLAYKQAVRLGDKTLLEYATFTLIHQYPEMGYELGLRYEDAKLMKESIKSILKNDESRIHTMNSLLNKKK
ncbi:MAG: hypothetical protein PHC66_03640 [Candidatus Nanoarchaeia archaeon]|nr:hypothetical protein [Candidatus Nanoarchaeia archaeon]MDD5238960.1 hypothetical protein [Candidatus Nanoarchaeia archaeon]